eukprot:3323825-Pyramimonas_sp.AAC.1
MPAKPMLSQSWVARLHGYSYPAMNGLKNGRICVSPYAHYMSLHGHPDSGGYWEQRCEGHVTTEGFVKCSPWRSCSLHKELKLFLIIYADDFKLSGPADKLAEGLSTQLVEWQGELPAMLDPPPPKAKKNAPVQNESSEEETEGDSAAQPPEPYQPREPRRVSVIE